MKELMW
jgi:hypothetical protein